MNGARSLGIAFLVLGGLAIGLGMQIEVLGLGQNADPGPRAFPMMLGAILMLGGLYELVWSFREKSRHPKPSTPEPTSADGVPGGRRRMVILYVGLCVYVGCIGVVGFGLSTFVFGVGMMRLLGVRWPVTIGTTLGLLVIIHLLFVGMFKVQLPTGTLGLPF